MSGRVLYRDRAGGDQPNDHRFVALTPAEKRALVEALPVERIGERVSRSLVNRCRDCATYCVDGLVGRLLAADGKWLALSFDYALPHEAELTMPSVE